MILQLQGCGPRCLIWLSSTFFLADGMWKLGPQFHLRCLITSALSQHASLLSEGATSARKPRSILCIRCISSLLLLLHVKVFPILVFFGRFRMSVAESLFSDSIVSFVETFPLADPWQRSFLWFGAMTSIWPAMGSRTTPTLTSTARSISARSLRRLIPSKIIISIWCCWLLLVIICPSMPLIIVAIEKVSSSQRVRKPMHLGWFLLLKIVAFTPLRTWSLHHQYAVPSPFESSLPLRPEARTVYRAVHGWFGVDTWDAGDVRSAR